MAGDPGVVDRLVLLVEGGVDGAVQRLPDWLAALAGIGAAAAAAVVAVTLESARYADEAIKAARAAEIQVDEYTALAYAADLAGASQSSLIAGSRALAIALDGARRNSREYIDALDAVGLTYEQATAPGESFVTLLPRIIDGLNEIESPLERVAVRQKLLGRASADMASLIAAGGDALRVTTEEAREFGLVIGEDAATASEDLNDNIARLRARARGLMLTFGLELVPVADRLVMSMGEMMDRMRPHAFDAIRVAASALAVVFDHAASPIGRLVLLLGSGGLAVAALRDAQALATLAGKIPVIGYLLKPLVGGMTAAAAAAAPWALALGAVLLVLDDLRAYMEGADSYIGDFAESMGIDSELYAALTSVWELLTEVAGLLGDTFVVGVEMAGDALDALAERFEFLRPIVDGIRDAIASLLDLDFGELVSSFALGAQFLRTGAQRVRGRLQGDQGPSDIRTDAQAAIQRVQEIQRDRQEQTGNTTVNLSPTVSIQGVSDPEQAARAARRELEAMTAEAYGQVGG